MISSQHGLQVAHERRLWGLTIRSARPLFCDETRMYHCLDTLLQAASTSISSPSSSSSSTSSSALSQIKFLQIGEAADEEDNDSGLYKIPLLRYLSEKAVTITLLADPQSTASPPPPLQQLTFLHIYGNVCDESAAIGPSLAAFSGSLQELSLQWSDTPSIAGMRAGDNTEQKEANCPLLRRLDLSHGGLKSLAGLEAGHEEHLESIKLTRNLSLTSIRELSGCKRLRNLCIRGCVSLSKLDGLENLLHLETLDASNTAIESLEPLRHCGIATFRTLDINNCCYVTSLKGLEGHEVLADVNAAYTDIRSIAELLLPPILSLRRLDITGCRLLESVEGLQILKELDITRRDQLKS